MAQEGTVALPSQGWLAQSAQYQLLERNRGNSMEWEPVIGLEIHAQLATNSKIFSGASTRYGGEPNTQACAVDLGLPGVLPVLNQEAVRMAVKFGLATGSTVARRSVFARKNYFYPDLPKGYQISQYELPIVHGGRLDIEGEDEQTKKTIGITRAHLEEDAGKSLHGDFHGMTGIDLNRAGTPLIEIVSEPDMRSAREAVAYMRKIHALVRYLEICDGNMQEGSFRCDANISVRLRGEEKLGTRAELKNLNSFRFVERAIQYEIERQIDILEAGGKVVQETRLYDPEKNETRSMRAKEEANDYRYFPDPDLLPVVLDADFIQEIRETLPELPDARKARFQSQYELGAIDAGLLASSRELADFYESTVAASGGEARLSANWIMVELTGALNKAGKEITESPMDPEMLGGMIRRITDGTISGKIAKKVFDAMWNGEGQADDIIDAKGLRQVTDSGEIERFIIDAIEKNPNQVAQYRAGKEKLLGFFVGQVMKASKGKANPQQVNERLREILAKSD
uniref:Aspartyl/glutamyl-tRNA(Asn/Gln) amidotransferase subunit B n=1 Tax=Candidatus Kentrum sp. UNK TaxID=2126344 RepID=A0A451B1P1_9GAMM|nr:MAG: aspartyl/glutamyl-tRNA(Asn/Gln) amidotransferase subunit B [Candidatus Kentron sp. UNK]VFK72177.1 MAG: aspartyl/glutamyl-tRNA(Asn/Gln) amidotransferase subunit B [Candidatus Kentron sp. UNK]